MQQDTVVRCSQFRGAFSLIRKTRFEATVIAVLVCLAVPMVMLAADNPNSDNPDSTAIGTRTVTGLVRDIACPLQNKKSTSTTYSKECITMCAKSGSPMGILTEDGTVYVPVTSSMPDTGQDALKPFIGEHVQATGKVFERNGGHAIEISEIHKLPSDAAGK